MYTEIFQEIVNIMHHDYAGYIDKKGWDHPEAYKDKIKDLENKGELTTNKFSEMVQDYLLDFKDHHLYFHLIKSDSNKEYDNGFRVRRYKNRLYVTAITKEHRLKPGDAIIALDQIPVSDLTEKHRRDFMESKAEREDWRKVISKYHVPEIIDSDGSFHFLELKKYEKAEYEPQHTIERLKENTIYMTLSDFWDASPIDHLLARHKKDLENTENLIIDVRTNLGGSDLSYKNIEKYLFPGGKNKIDLSFYNNKINCTERNADFFISQIEKMLDKMDNEKDRDGLKRWKEETWEKHRGNGFVNFDKEDSMKEYEITGLNPPNNIIVLVDNYCGSAGDIFVYLCKQSPKVTVIGRPTMGLNDYSNLAVMQWHDQFELMYATSRLDQLDTREPGVEQGIKPDIYVPWNPEHIYKDFDMEEAMSVLREKKQ